MWVGGVWKAVWELAQRFNTKFSQGPPPPVKPRQRQTRHLPYRGWHTHFPAPPKDRGPAGEGEESGRVVGGGICKERVRVNGPGRLVSKLRPLRSPLPNRPAGLICSATFISLPSSSQNRTGCGVRGLSVKNKTRKH